MNNIVLSKNSSDNEIERYFKAVFALSKANEEFPVNLDEVWPLVYNRKDYAVDALKKDFIEGVDFTCTSVKTEVGSIKYEFNITVPCMEFFIARKVREVFEIYRKVFHIATSSERRKPVKAPSVRDKMAVASWMIKTLNLNDNSKLRLVKAIADPLGLPSPDYTESKDQLLSATELLKRCGSTLSAQAFNAKMLAKGLLTTLQRQSHRGMKKFKSLTDKGLEFGENQVSPNNPKETQPLYYVGRFPELLQLVGITKEYTTDGNK